MPPVTATDESRLDVVHVLLLIQAALGTLSGLAMLLLMSGNPLALPLTLGVPLLLFVVAAAVARRRPWALKLAVLCQFIILAGFAVSFLLGLLAQLDFSLNLATLLTNLAIPIWLIKLVRQLQRDAIAGGPVESQALPAGRHRSFEMAGEPHG
jgi:hypothetical protein